MGANLKKGGKKTKDGNSGEFKEAAANQGHLTVEEAGPRREEER